MNVIKIFIDNVFRQETSILNVKIDQALRIRHAAKTARDITHKKIDNIYAQLNGCVEKGDKWFLTPRKTIDECAENKDNGSQT